MYRSFSKSLQKTILGVSLIALSACGAGERLSQIGRAPEFTPIENVKAPHAQRSISLPMPGNDGKPDYSPNSLWRTGAKAFFKDQRASRVGDIVTVEIDISDQARIGNTTARSRSTTEGAGLPNLLGLEQAIPNLFTRRSSDNSSITDIRGAFDPSNLVNADSTSDYEGTGSVDRSETIRMTVAAIVNDILPNGNLVIQARQEVRVNFEKRELLLAGIIRPEDISSTNTIQHSQIAEARISYGGQGQISDVQQPRYGTQFYDIIFPF